MADQAVDENSAVSTDVLKLGLVSLLTDLSSEMIFSVFAVFFTSIAGASAALLGVIEGLAGLSARFARRRCTLAAAPDRGFYSCRRDFRVRVSGLCLLAA